MAPTFDVVEHASVVRREPLKQRNICSTSESSKIDMVQEQSVRVSAERFPFPESYNFLTALNDQLLTVLDSKPTAKHLTSVDEIEDPVAQPMIWISSWVDYTQKYGFTYVLCDKSIGVAFIDCTKVVLMPNGHNIQYTDQNGSELYFTVSQFDKCLTKKMKLLRVPADLCDSNQDWCFDAGTRVRPSACPLELDTLSQPLLCNCQMARYR